MPYLNKLSTPANRSKSPVDQFNSNSVDDYHFRLTLIYFSFIIRFYFLIMLNSRVGSVGQKCFHSLVGILTDPSFTLKTSARLMSKGSYTTIGGIFTAVLKSGKVLVVKINAAAVTNPIPGTERSSRKCLVIS